MSIPERLRYARQRAGLTGAQVRERTGIGESSLSEFERGKREPRLSQLQALAEAYRRSLAFLLGEGPIPHEAVLWRLEPEGDKRGLEAVFLRLCEQYHNLELWCGERARLDLPQALGGRLTYGYRDATELAKQVRHDLGLGDRPGGVLLRVLEEACGVKVFHLSFTPAGAAASTVSEAFGAGVLLNALNAPWRRTFDLAHELFHLLTWRIFRAEERMASGHDEEKLAGCFARNLLLPAEAVETALHTRVGKGRPTFHVLVAIAREFDVSVDALLWQLHFLRRSDSAEDAEKTRQDIAKARLVEAASEPREWPQPPERPPRYHALAVKALGRAEMSVGRFAEYLGISRQKAMRYVEQEIPGDEEAQVDPA